MLASLWITGGPSTSSENTPKNTLSEKRGSQPRNIKADAEFLLEDAEALMFAQGFALQPSRPAANMQESAAIPKEWEGSLFDILLDDTQTMDQRNARLIELAIGPAKGVPAVQEECVVHLLFGLSDDDGAQFLAVVTNTAIPAMMRAEFLKQALEMRPQELGDWLGQQVSNHYDPEISTIARLYLLDRKASEQ